jgi:hypothetical protein
VVAPSLLARVAMQKLVRPPAAAAQLLQRLHSTNGVGRPDFCDATTALVTGVEAHTAKNQKRVVDRGRRAGQQLTKLSPAHERYWSWAESM